MESVFDHMASVPGVQPASPVFFRSSESSRAFQSVFDRVCLLAADFSDTDLLDKRSAQREGHPSQHASFSDPLFML